MQLLFYFLTLTINFVGIFRDERSTGDPFVVTSAMKKTVEMVLLAVKQRLPVLLYGPTGSGKSALISKLSQDSGNQGIYCCVHLVENQLFNLC